MAEAKIISTLNTISGKGERERGKQNKMQPIRKQLDEFKEYEQLDWGQLRFSNSNIYHG